MGSIEFFRDDYVVRNELAGGKRALAKFFFPFVAKFLMFIIPTRVYLLRKNDSSITIY
jgi:hypothetical protein